MIYGTEEHNISNAKFSLDQNVRVSKGSYKGKSGKIIYVDRRWSINDQTSKFDVEKIIYKVRLGFFKSVVVNEDCLEAIPDYKARAEFRDN